MSSYFPMTGFKATTGDKSAILACLNSINFSKITHQAILILISCNNIRQSANSLAFSFVTWRCMQFIKRILKG